MTPPPDTRLPATPRLLAQRVAERLRGIEPLDRSDTFVPTAALPAIAALVEAHGRYVEAWNNLNVPGEEGDQALVDAQTALRSLADALGVEG